MEFNENQVKHLEFIQSNIARMNQCSFQMKGWMLTIVSALLALYAGSISPETGSGINMFIYNSYCANSYFLVFGLILFTTGKKI